VSTLLIVESPAKRKTITAILGPGFAVEASMGHVRDLPRRAIAVAPPDFSPAYELTERGESVVARLRKAAAGVDRVLLATDPDREGEAIAWHLCEVLGLRNAQRVTFGEITERAVRAAMAAPRPLAMPLVRAQEARRVLDRLVGYLVSPALSDRAEQSLSAGRVQSPAVRLVHEREQAIRAFQVTRHFAVELRFAGDPAWSAKWSPTLPEGQAYVLDPAAAQAAARVRAVRVVSCEDSTAAVAPPAPFTTSTLQQRAQAALKLKPAVTMQLAQKLYEAGHITYMRTDSPNLSDDACQAIAEYARGAGLPLAAERRRWKAKGDAQEAHEAIRPSDVTVVEAGDTPQEQALYRLIWQRAVASQLADATFAVRAAELVDAGDGGHCFLARGRTPIAKGWKVVYAAAEGGEPADDADAAEGADGANPVPALTADQCIDAADGVVLAKKTKPPARFTLATLIKELEAHGIGRPSTYAAILDTIEERGYITEDKKGAVSITALGERVVTELVGHFRFVDLDYTRELEDGLDAVAAGRNGYRDLVAGAHAALQCELGALPPPADRPTCPACGAAMRRRQGARGAFWGCSAYPTCRQTLAAPAGTPEGAAPGAVASAPACPDCGKALRHNVRAKQDDPKGKGWDFWGCTGFPGCKSTYRPGPDGGPLLPEAA
jgi:DNA topoisomerase I